MWLAVLGRGTTLPVMGSARRLGASIIPYIHGVTRGEPLLPKPVFLIGFTICISCLSTSKVIVVSTMADVIFGLLLLL